MSNINVIDAPCGMGKTSWAIQEINAHEDESYIFCTPFLGEITRIRQSCGLFSRFKEPLPYTGTKIDDFNNLLSTGVDIAVTHTTFLNATPETLEAIRTGDYTLIIDEVLDVITDFNTVQTVAETPRQKVSKDDLKMLIENHLIEIGSDYKVTWCGNEYGADCKFSEVERFAKLNRLYCVDGRLLLTVFPPEMFSCFKQVYILTYMFQSSMFKYYFDLFGIEYTLLNVAKQGDKYYLQPYSATYDVEFRYRCKELISICDNPKMNQYRTNALSKSWYENSRTDDRLHELRNNLAHYFTRYLKGASASNGDIMWTTYSDYEQSLKGKGYTRTRNLTEQERRCSPEAKKMIEQELSCFVPCNSRATNIYRNRWALGYCVNMHFNPMLRRFFTDNNQSRIEKGLEPILPNDDLYALSCLLQWLFRSRIRSGQPISIYIPSRRMRQLLIDWLDGKNQ